MFITEFIEQQYPIRDRVIGKLEDPYTRIANMDDLPYDKIGPDENGVITKLVELEEGRWISVVDLMSMSEDEVEKSGDDALKLVYDNYMSQIDLQELNMIDILNSLRSHKEFASKREGQLNALRI